MESLIGVFLIFENIEINERKILIINNNNNNNNINSNININESETVSVTTMNSTDIVDNFTKFVKTSVAKGMMNSNPTILEAVCKADILLADK